MKFKIFNFFLFYLYCFSSCTNLSIKKELNTNQLTTELKANLVYLFNVKNDNSDFDYGDISNVDKINGFRSVKLGLDLDSIDYSDFFVDSTLIDYNILKLKDKGIILSNIMIGNNKIKFVELSFLNNKLNEINIDYGSDAADAMEMLINIYGKPTNYNLLRGRILNKLDEINIRNSKITNPVMKGLNPIRAEEDIILSSTPYIWETRKIEITFILKSYLTNGANRYSEPIENTRNILNIITKDFQRYVLDVEQEIENKREELEFNNYQRIKKEKLNEF